MKKLPEYQKRVVQERADLADNVFKLRAFIDGEAFNTLSEFERRDMLHQISAMCDYLNILARRIARFNA